MPQPRPTFVLIVVLYGCFRQQANASDQCDQHCQKQTLANSITRIKLLRLDAADHRYLDERYGTDPSSAALLKAAKDERTLNRARAELGLKPIDTEIEAQLDENFNRSMAKQERLEDRANYNQQQELNREALREQQRPIIIYHY
ncbi:MAG: hypothetical protein ACREEE_00725 [Dongiaceae bacterium]